MEYNENDSICEQELEQKDRERIIRSLIDAELEKADELYISQWVSILP